MRTKELITFLLKNIARTTLLSANTGNYHETCIMFLLYTLTLWRVTAPLGNLKTIIMILGFTKSKNKNKTKTKKQRNKEKTPKPNKKQKQKQKTHKKKKKKEPENLLM